MYKIVQRARAGAPTSPCLGCTSHRPMRPTRSRPAATRSTPPSAAPRASSGCSTSASCAASSATSSLTSTTGTSSSSSVAATLASAIMFLAQFAYFFGGGNRTTRTATPSPSWPWPSRSDRRLDHPARDQQVPRVPGRRVGGHADARPARPGQRPGGRSRLGVAAAPLPPEPAAADHQRADDREPVQDGGASTPVLDPPPDRRAHRPARGDGVRRLPTPHSQR